MSILTDEPDRDDELEESGEIMSLELLNVYIFCEQSSQLFQPSHTVRVGGAVSEPKR